MSQVRIQGAASWRLDEIYRHARERWGEAQAERYITGLFDAFGRVEPHTIATRPVPAKCGVQGFFFRYEHHFVHWLRLSNGDIGIVTILLLERMHQFERLRDDFFGEPPPNTGSPIRSGSLFIDCIAPDFPARIPAWTGPRPHRDSGAGSQRVHGMWPR